MQEVVREAFERKESHRLVVRGADGGKAGQFGGRPKQPEADKRGIYNGSDRSNRLFPGQERRRQDGSFVEALWVCQHVAEQSAMYSDKDVAWRVMVMRYMPRSKAQLQALVGRKGVFETCPGPQAWWHEGNIRPQARIGHAFACEEVYSGHEGPRRWQKG